MSLSPALARIRSFAILAAQHEIDLPNRQAAILLTVANEPKERHTANSMAEMLGINSTSAWRAIARLCDLGLLERTEQEGREKPIKITTFGRTHVKHMEKAAGG